MGKKSCAACMMAWLAVELGTHAAVAKCPLIYPDQYNIFRHTVICFIFVLSLIHKGIILANATAAENTCSVVSAPGVMM
jgi:hypothetical protein